MPTTGGEAPLMRRGGPPFAVLLTVMACLAAMTTSPRAAAGPAVRITVWLWKGAMDGVSRVMPKFKKAYPKIEVQFLVDPKVRQKLLLGLSAAGAGLPDVSLLSTLRIPQYARLNGFLDLRSLIETELYPPYVIKDISSGRALVAVPWDIGSSGTYYRRDVFAAAGLAADPAGVARLIDTWEHYLATGRIIKAKTGRPLLCLSPTGDLDLFQAFLQQRRKDFFLANGRPGFNNSVGVRALTYQKRLIDAGVTATAAQWDPDWNRILDDGGVATLPMSVWMIGNLKGWISPGKGAGRWGVAPIPGWREGYAAPTNWGGSSWVVPKYTRNKEAALAFVQFVTSRGAVLAMMRDTGIFPARRDAYNDPMFDEEDPYFGGQRVYRFFAKQALKPIDEVPSPYMLTAQNILNDAMAAFLSGRKSAPRALEEAEARLIGEMR